MNIVPLISIKKGDIYNGDNGTVLSLDDLFGSAEKDTMLYVLDLDGIEHNNPNLELYQRLSEQYTLWIDNGPRRIDDVMDTIMAGATNLTLRLQYWPTMNLSEVNELTDDEVYLAYDLSSPESSRSIPFDITGIVVFNEPPHDETEFLTTSHLKNRATTLKTYLYTAPPDAKGYWENQGLTGILVDLKKKEEYH